MALRTELQAELEGIMTGLKMDSHVYFEPPTGFQMKYPCIVYRRDSLDTTHANNNPYFLSKTYEVTVIDADPESPLPEAIAMMPKCRHTRSFVNDNLHHDIFNINY